MPSITQQDMSALGMPAIVSSLKHFGTAVAALLVVGILLDNSYFVTHQNEVSSVTNLGRLDRGPLGAGFHMKEPFIETAYTLMVSKQNLVIHEVVGKTSNNQRVTFADLNITWHINPEDANTALFKVGAMGKSDIAENFVPVVRDRTLRVLGRYTTTDINAQKEKIATEIMAEAGPAVHEMFGVTLDSVQIPRVDYDPAFEASVAAAVAAQNQAVQAEAQLKAIRIQAEQAKATAEGQAAAQVAAAEADARKQVLNAESAARAVSLNADAQAHATEVAADAQAKATETTAKANADAVTLSGNAEAAVLTAKVAAVGGPQAYNLTLQSQALGKWNGSVPSMIFGGGDKGGPMAFLPLPLPAVASQADH
jgi:regulator of protease activity HflC (stomatin/prohibitin superfamily)